MRKLLVCSVALVICTPALARVRVDVTTITAPDGHMGDAFGRGA